MGPATDESVTNTKGHKKVTMKNLTITHECNLRFLPEDMLQYQVNEARDFPIDEIEGVEHPNDAHSTIPKKHTRLGDWEQVECES
jgi:hypothetical protein